MSLTCHIALINCRLIKLNKIELREARVSTEKFINRELSLLRFNWRVLQQASNTQHPLLERLGFLRIFSSNLDEFFEIRVAGLRRQQRINAWSAGPDGMTAGQVLHEISNYCRAAVEHQYHLFNDELLPALAEQGIRFLRREQWTATQALWVKNYFAKQVYPVLTPIALDPSHPFPRVVNKSLNFIVALEGRDAFGRAINLAIIPAPRSLPRMIRLPDEVCEDGDNYVFLSSVIHEHASDLFPGMQVQGCYQFRVTRDADLDIEDIDKDDDLAEAIKDELLSRRYGEAVRLEVTDSCPQHLSDYLLSEFELDEGQLYRVNGPVNLVRLITDIDRENLRWRPFMPSVPECVIKCDSVFECIKKQDILLHHPYQSFGVVIEFLRQAARDPNVLAIKQTLYRTGKNSEMVLLLCDAAKRGIEVTVVIELTARFDEESNLELAETLQEAGCVVVYGVVGYKTHAKMILVVRRENNELVRYAHLGTGNYHAVTARIYTDISLLTAERELCSDVHKIFQQLTGLGRAARLKKLLNAPFTLHRQLLAHIKQETTNAKKGIPAAIKLRMNSLTEIQLIEALYAASRAGVQVDLIVRGMCSLRPGVTGMSDNIRVRSIVGRFLEHSRVFYFANGGEPVIYCASADWMDRNMFRRVEVCFPITDPELAARVERETLNWYLKDNSLSWQLQANGEYVANSPSNPNNAFNCQQQLLASLALSS